MVEGYVAPLYRQPLYRERAAYAFAAHGGPLDYADGLCPVCERMHEHEVLFHPLVHAGLGDGRHRRHRRRVPKVHARRGELGGA